MLFLCKYLNDYFLIIRWYQKRLLRKTSLDAFKKLRTNIINTNFDDNWQINVIKFLMEYIKND